MPRTIVITPLPAPYSTAKMMKLQVESPANTKSSIEAGSSANAIAPTFVGARRCPTDISDRRPSTCIGPISAPSVAAWVALKPLATIIARRWTDIAENTNALAVKAAASK